MRRLSLVALAIAAVLWTWSAQAEQITVFAAASMKDVLERSAEAYEASAGTEIVLSFAASSILARQIEAGAGADAFISADQAWMDWLAERGLVRPETRRTVAGNTLVVAAAADTATADNPRELLVAGRFTMGDPQHVPAGKYARAALETLGLWDEVRPNAVFGENVRVALEYARRGELSAAIVYGSDLHGVSELTAAYVFPADSHKPIAYPAAVVVNGQDEAAAFLDFLSGEPGQRIFAEYGFAPPASGGEQ